MKFTNNRAQRQLEIDEKDPREPKKTNAKYVTLSKVRKEKEMYLPGFNQSDETNLLAFKLLTLSSLVDTKSEIKTKAPIL